MADITTRAGKGSPLTNNEVDANFTNLNDDKLESSQYTASDVLDKIKTVDGSGSGLDADLLDGNQATDFATSAQGALADSALQSGDNVSELNNDAGYLTSVPSTAIDDLSDVTITSVGDNEVLAYDTTSSAWINQTASEAGLATSAQGALADSALQSGDNVSELTNDSGYITSASVSGLTDTTITSVGDNEVLAYDTASSKWINQTASEAGLATSAQGSLADSALQPNDNISELTNDSGYLTGNQTITLDGDVSGSGTTSITVTVADDSHNHIISNVDGLQTALDNKLETSLKGSANGLAELDANGLVPSSQLPSYVDDVLEYANLAGFPATGETGKIYVAQDTGDIYRWSGSAYIKISDAASTSDEAVKLATARTISLSGDVSGSTTFDGSANVTIAATVADDSHNHIISNVDGLQTALDAKQDASTAIESGDNVSELNNDAGYITSASLDGLTDTTITSVADNQILAYDSATSSWVNQDPDSGASSVEELTDTTITDVADNEVLAYDSTSSKWINQTPAEAGLATSAQGSLADSALQSGDNVSELTNDSGYITGNQTITLSGDVSGSGTTSISVTLTKDPVITLSGAVTGSATMTNLGNVTISTTATSDPTLTLSGDLSGSATFTNLGNATLNAQIVQNAITTTELSVSGNGTAGQILSSDGDGTFSWANASGGAEIVQNAYDLAYQTLNNKGIYLYGPSSNTWIYDSGDTGAAYFYIDESGNYTKTGLKPFTAYVGNYGKPLFVNAMSGYQYDGTIGYNVNNYQDDGYALYIFNKRRYIAEGYSGDGWYQIGGGGGGGAFVSTFEGSVCRAVFPDGEMEIFITSCFISQPAFSNTLLTIAGIIKFTPLQSSFNSLSDLSVVAIEQENGNVNSIVTSDSLAGILGVFPSNFNYLSNNVSNYSDGDYIAIRFSLDTLTVQDAHWYTNWVEQNGVNPLP